MKKGSYKELIEETPIGHATATELEVSSAYAPRGVLSAELGVIFFDVDPTNEYGVSIEKSRCALLSILGLPSSSKYEKDKYSNRPWALMPSSSSSYLWTCRSDTDGFILKASVFVKRSATAILSWLISQNITTGLEGVSEKGSTNIKSYQGGSIIVKRIIFKGSITSARRDFIIITSISILPDGTYVVASRSIYAPEPSLLSRRKSKNGFIRGIIYASGFVLRPVISSDGTGCELFLAFHLDMLGGTNSSLSSVSTSTSTSCLNSSTGSRSANDSKLDNLATSVRKLMEIIELISNSDTNNDNNINHNSNNNKNNNSTNNNNDDINNVVMVDSECSSTVIPILRISMDMSLSSCLTDSSTTALFTTQNAAPLIHSPPHSHPNSLRRSLSTSFSLPPPPSLSSSFPYHRTKHYSLQNIKDEDIDIIPSIHINKGNQKVIHDNINEGKIGLSDTSSTTVPDNIKLSINQINIKLSINQINIINKMSRNSVVQGKQICDFLFTFLKNSENIKSEKNRGTFPQKGIFPEKGTFQDKGTFPERGTSLGLGSRWRLPSSLKLSSQSSSADIPKGGEEEREKESEKGRERGKSNGLFKNLKASWGTSSQSPIHTPRRREYSELGIGKDREQDKDLDKDEVRDANTDRHRHRRSDRDRDRDCAEGGEYVQGMNVPTEVQANSGASALSGTWEIIWEQDGVCIYELASTFLTGTTLFVAQCNVPVRFDKRLKREFYLNHALYTTLIKFYFILYHYFVYLVSVDATSNQINSIS